MIIERSSAVQEDTADAVRRIESVANQVTVEEARERKRLDQIMQPR